MSVQPLVPLGVVQKTTQRRGPVKATITFRSSDVDVKEDQTLKRLRLRCIGVSFQNKEDVTACSSWIRWIERRDKGWTAPSGTFGKILDFLLREIGEPDAYAQAFVDVMVLMFSG
ncbi:hypothetical protein EVAR_33865_1 [Eumeta japonica]|uniref:Uncharacterized protein n=1 Tax=Eumeta variegata TaxID=151549 RepID=A0A4C1X8D4_EUMVA|nr:hypothetical protein EVAR_33865_1 [Eumeta japonica]